MYHPRSTEYFADHLVIGRERELQAARFLQHHGWRIWAHDIKILGVQVDLIAERDDGELWIYEVKSASVVHVCERALKTRQLLRLRRVQCFLQDHAEGRSVQLAVIMCSESQILVLPC